MGRLLILKDSTQENNSTIILIALIWASGIFILMVLSATVRKTSPSIWSPIILIRIFRNLGYKNLSFKSLLNLIEEASLNMLLLFFMTMTLVIHFLHLSLKAQKTLRNY